MDRDYVVLQQDLDAMTEWKSKSGHGIPSSEMQCPECIKIQTPFRPPSHKLIGHIIITEDATKYLGVNLKATVSWKTHIESISKKPNSMPRILRRSRRSCGEDRKQQKKLQLVRLNFEYCLDPAQEVLDSEIRDKSKNSCLVHNKPKQEHKQPAINSQASPVGISRFQAFQNSTDTDR